MFGFNCFQVRTKSRAIAIMKYYIRGDQLVAYLMVYVSTLICIEFETCRAYFIGSSHIFPSSLTWLLKLVTVDLSLNTRVSFSMVMIKKN